VGGAAGDSGAMRGVPATRVQLARTHRGLKRSRLVGDLGRSGRVRGNMVRAAEVVKGRRWRPDVRYIAHAQLPRRAARNTNDLQLASEAKRGVDEHVGDVAHIAGPSAAGLRVDANEVAKIIRTTQNETASQPNLSALTPLRLFVRASLGSAQIDQISIRHQIAVSLIKEEPATP
jgi:hypothetical protein